jgi:branched-chain amino acid transport system ATP-binding protein
MNATPVLAETVGLTMRFGGLTAIDGLDFGVRPGESVGLIGPNGSGKSTFLNVLTGIYRPTGGAVRYAGESLVGVAPYRIAMKGVARTFQSNRLFSNLSVLDNVLLGMHRDSRATWMDAIFRRASLERELKRNVERAVALLGQFSRQLAEDMYRKAAELPYADRRRLEICRALASEPRLLLLDEPSAGMTPDETRKLMDDIGAIRARAPSIAIIVIEHDMGLISRVTDRVVVLNYGRKIAEGRFEEVAELDEVLEAYLGREDDDA